MRNLKVMTRREPSLSVSDGSGLIQRFNGVDYDNDICLVALSSFRVLYCVCYFVGIGCRKSSVVLAPRIASKGVVIQSVGERWKSPRSMAFGLHCGIISQFLWFLFCLVIAFLYSLVLVQHDEGNTAIIAGWLPGQLW